MNDMNTLHNKQSGAMHWSVIAVIVLSVLFAGAGSFAIWAFVNYQDYKSNTESKVEAAVNKARKVQAEEDEEKFSKRENQPFRQFVGPKKLGRVTFDYPKTWAAYEAESGKENASNYSAYFAKQVVPTVSDTERFRLRVSILQEDYSSFVKSFADDVKEGKLKTSVFTANGQSGTRIDGTFSESIKGSAVVMKIRDKTLYVRTDSNSFLPEFEDLIKTIRFES